ncbi:MAG: hypothetical protein IPJ19_13670 [Planctomycetes bacterium]|nr:hypothetical protein [Planctomycetota bacterium]
MKPRARKVLWILFGILLIASLFVAGPAHNILHHDAQDIGGCDVCHFASPEAPTFQPVVFWICVEALEEPEASAHVPDHLLAEQGNARAPPVAG